MEITKSTDVCGAYIRFWPTLMVWHDSVLTCGYSKL
jgi:hypothetical protein